MGYIRFYYAMSLNLIYRNICLIFIYWWCASTLGYIMYWRRHANVTGISCRIWRKSQCYYQRSLCTLKSFYSSRADEIISKYLPYVAVPVVRFFPFFCWNCNLEKLSIYNFIWEICNELIEKFNSQSDPYPSSGADNPLQQHNIWNAFTFQWNFKDDGLSQHVRHTSKFGRVRWTVT